MPTVPSGVGRYLVGALRANTRCRLRCRRATASSGRALRVKCHPREDCSPRNGTSIARFAAVPFFFFFHAAYACLLALAYSFGKTPPSMLTRGCVAPPKPNPTHPPLPSCALDQQHAWSELKCKRAACQNTTTGRGIVVVASYRRVQHRWRPARSPHQRQGPAREAQGRWQCDWCDWCGRAQAHGSARS